MILVVALLIEIISTFFIRIIFNLDTIEGLILVLLNIVIFLLWVVTNKKITKNQRILLILSYLVRVVIIIIRQITNISVPYTAGDAQGFHVVAGMVANNMSLLQDSVYGGLYTKCFGILYYFIGINRIFAENINVLLQIGIFYNVFLIINKIKIKNNIINTLLQTILVFFPNGILLSASMLREMVIGFFVILSLRYCIEYLQYNNKLYILLCLGSIIFAAIFHAGVIFLIVGYVFIISFYSVKEKKMNIDIKKLLVFIILTIVLIWFYTSYGNIFAAKINNINLDELEDTLESKSNGGSAYLGGKEINGISDIIIYTIPKTIYFLFSPMPWDCRGVADIISFLLDSLVYLYLIYNIIKHHKHINTKDKGVFNSLLFGLLLCIVVMGLGTSTAGTAIRHRYKIFPYLVTLVILLINYKDKGKNNSKERNTYGTT